MRHLLSPAISHAAATAREYHLTQAESLSADIDMLEHHGHCEVKAKVPRVAHHGQSLLDAAKMLKAKLRSHVHAITDLTDYDDDAHLDPGWLSRALTAAADCRPSHYDPAGVSGRWAGQRAA